MSIETRKGTLRVSNAPGSDRKSWTSTELQALRRLAREGTSHAAALALGRTVLSVRQKALKTGISFRPAQPAAARLKLGRKPIV